MMGLTSFSRVGWWEKEQCGIWQNWPAGVLCCLLLFLIGARESLSPGGGSINVVPGMQLLVIICKIRWFWWMKMRQSMYRNNENEMLWWLKKRNYFLTDISLMSSSSCILGLASCFSCNTNMMSQKARGHGDIWCFTWNHILWIEAMF